jgi:curved DNA-binding protein CbpA
MNPYEILDLPKDASLDQIKQKYKSLAQVYHPDKGGDAEKFRQIKEAYEILSDPLRRKKYDDTGDTSVDRDIRDECLEKLLSMFNHLSANIDPDREDIVLRMRVEARSAKQAMEHSIGLCNQHIKKLNRLLFKLRFKGNGENFLKEFTKKKLEDRQNELKIYYRQIRVAEGVLEMLENYEWGIEGNLLQQ